MATRYRAITHALVAAGALIVSAADVRAEWPATPAACVPAAVGAGDEEISHVVPDGLGGMLVVWTNDVGGDSDVFAQRVDAGGNPLWGSGGAPVAQATGDQTAPRVVDDGSGGAIVVWTDDRSSGSTQADIYAQRILADGTPAWATDGIAVCDQFNDQVAPRLTTDGLGGAIIAWRDSRTGQARVWAQRLMSDGTDVWAADGIDISASGVADEFVIVTDDLGGAFVIWDDTQTTFYEFQHVNADGTVQLPAGGEIIGSYQGGFGHAAPTACADGVGGFWVGYSYFDDFKFFDRMFVIHYGANNVMVNGTEVTSFDETPKLAPDGAGGVLVAWHQSLDIIVGRFDPGAVALFQYVTLDVPLQSSTARNWDIVPDGAGGAIITTRDGLGDPQAIRVTADGSTPWGDGNPGLKLAYSSTTYPYAVPDLLNGALVVWADGDLCAARADRHGYVGNPRAFVTAADDIPGDQGGSILTSWDASPLDVFPNQTITRYAVWRQAAGAARSVTTDVDESTLARARDMGFAVEITQELARNGWEPIGTVSSAYQSSYAFETPTYADSTVQGPAPMNVKVFAQTSDPFVFWESNVGTGQSIDNLAPGAPVNATVAQGGVNTLTWEAPYAPDLSFYRIYRGTTPDFPLDGSSYVAAVTGLEWVDEGGGDQFIYKITAVDDAWNESEPATPDVVVGIPSVALPARFAVHGNTPNPFNPRTTVRFNLPAAADRVTVRIYDAGGRIVRDLHDGGMPAGAHEIVWDGRNDAGSGVSSGVYVLVVRAGAESARIKMVMLQ